jgi:hypothetical protein
MTRTPPRDHSLGRKEKSIMAGPYVVPPGFQLIFRAWITGRDGKRIYAKWFGLKGFPLLVPIT